MQKLSTILSDFLPACRNIIFIFFYAFLQFIFAILEDIYKNY